MIRADGVAGGEGGAAPDPTGAAPPDEGAILEATRAGGGPRRLALQALIVLVLLLAAQAYDGSLHALSHWFILGAYGVGALGFGLAEWRGGPRAAAFAWAGTALNAGLAVYVIIEHMLAGGGIAEGSTTVSRLPAFLLLIQTGLSMRLGQTLLFCGLVTASWGAAILAGLADPGLFPGPDTIPVSPIIGLATFVAACLITVDGITRLRTAVARTLHTERAREKLARFVPDAVARDLAGDAHALRRRHACLLVLDVRGFSRLSQEHPPEAMVAALLAVRAAAQGAVAAHGGIVDKYIGDAVLAQFVVGTPQAQARAALACAGEIRARIATLDAARARAGLFPVRVVVALHAGDLLVGVFDDGVRAEYTVLGPAMNALSRIEARAKAADIALAASRDFLELLGGALPDGCTAVPAAAAPGQAALFAIVAAGPRDRCRSGPDRSPQAEP